MAIQLRRGAYIDFDPTKLTPGEAAVIVSGDPGNVSGVALYLCFSSGVVKRFALTEELESALNDFTVDWSDVTNKPVIKSYTITDPNDDGHVIITAS